MSTYDLLLAIGIGSIPGILFHAWVFFGCPWPQRKRSHDRFRPPFGN